MSDNAWPTTVNEAADLTIAFLSDEDKQAIKSMKKRQLFQLHFGLGMTIRNQFGLWRENNALLADAKVTHPDDASHVIWKGFGKN